MYGSNSFIKLVEASNKKNKGGFLKENDSELVGPKDLENMDGFKEEEVELTPEEQKSMFKGWAIAKGVEQSAYLSNNIEDVMNDFKDDVAKVLGEDQITVETSEFQAVVGEVQEKLGTEGGDEAASDDASSDASLDTTDGASSDTSSDVSSDETNPVSDAPESLSTDSTGSDVGQDSLDTTDDETSLKPKEEQRDYYESKQDRFKNVYKKMTR
jgi:hypothetical protein